MRQLQTIITITLVQLMILSWAFAGFWEMGLRVVDNSNTLVARQVRLFEVANLATPYREGTTASSSVDSQEDCGDLNGICDINGNEVPTDVAIWDPIYITTDWASFYMVIRADDGLYYYCELIIQWSEDPESRSSVDHVVEFNVSNHQFQLCYNAGNVTLIVRGQWPYVTIDQRLSDNQTSVGQIGVWETATASFLSKTVPTAIDVLNRYPNPVLKATQSVLSGEKYNNWDDDLSNVQNPRSFPLSPNRENPVVSKLLPTYTVTLQTNIDNGTSGVIYFKDPWLVDSTHAVTVP
jgi:hypothetical protein